jgi:hypothetical protein
LDAPSFWILVSEYAMSKYKHTKEAHFLRIGRAFGRFLGGSEMLMDGTTPPAAVLIPLQRATRHLGNPNRSTALRWVLDGVTVPTGEVVKLWACRFGKRWMTSQDAVEQFVRATTTPSEARNPPRTITARRRALEDAADQLRGMGM